MSASWYAVRNVATESAEVAIYDEIGLFGITAKEFTNSLKSLGDRRITLRIHSPGGSIFEGHAIYNALRRHKGGVDVAIDGLAASMASVIAMAGEKRSMAENAMFMIHNPWTMTFGESKDLRRDADLMDDLKEGIVSAFAGRTGIKREKLAAMMDEETWLNAEEAKEMGFVTDITERFDMRNSFERFDIKKFSNRPNDFMTTTEETQEATPKVVDTPAAIAEVVADPTEAEKIEAGFQAMLAVEREQAITSIAAKEAIIDGLNAEVSGLKADLQKVREDFSRLEKYAQVAAAREVVIVPEQTPKSNLEIYNEMSDGPERTAFYKAHRDELVKLVNQKA